MRIGSLFSGIGGLELGLERSGLGRVLWQVESDEYCRRVLAKHWPDADRSVTDVRRGGSVNLRRVGVICGGFPCQDISDAGARAGLAGSRSGLWYEFARIVREIRPRVVVVENVSALLVRGIDRVLGDLAEVGYDCEWHCISAAAVGAPHLRDRVFILGYSDGESESVEPVDDEASGLSGVAADSQRVGRGTRPRVPRDEAEARIWRGEPHYGGEDAADSDSAGLSQREGAGSGGAWSDERPLVAGGDWWDVEPDVGRMANGVPSRVDRLKGLGNAVVPQVAEAVGRIAMRRLCGH